MYKQACATIPWTPVSENLLSEAIKPYSPPCVDCVDRIWLRVRYCKILTCRICYLLKGDHSPVPQVASGLQTKVGLGGPIVRDVYRGLREDLYGTYCNFSPGPM